MDAAAAHRIALALAQPTAAVANYCDHVEHNESADRRWVLDAAEALRDCVTEVSIAEDLSALDLYATRLNAVEARNVLSSDESLDGPAIARAAKTWRDLQLVQMAHDREYHPDVIGLAKVEQLRHYALHMAKIVGAFADPRPDIFDLLKRRVPDALIFGLKLPTVMGERLPDEPLPGRPSSLGGRVRHESGR